MNEFVNYARDQFHESSPLYEQLSRQVTEDNEVLSLVTTARTDEPSVPLLFFGAVQFLLLKNPEEPLSQFYPRITRKPKAEGDSYPAFRSFCLSHQSEIRALINSRRVQTNEVQRCACMLPAFSLGSRRANGRPLAMVEVGASAGLNLLWDKYGYQYENGVKCGDQTSPVRIFCGIRGDVPPPAPSTFPTVLSRVGIDLDPLDLENEDDVLWLRSLVWPEHRKRAELLEEAIELARQYPLPLVKGHALEVLPSLLNQQPETYEICVFDSNTLFRFSDEELAEFNSLLQEFSKKRDLFHVSYEWWRGSNWQQLDLAWFRNGSVQREHLAFGHPYGEWLQWVQRTS